MIVILKRNPDKEQLSNLVSWFESKGLQIHKTEGMHQTILGLVGDTAGLDIDLISSLDIVEDVKRVLEPYKNANRKFHPEDTVVKVRGAEIGGGTLTIMAGPCSIESEEQIVEVAQAVKAAGAKILRGGAFKPRTSPYAFQGLGANGLDLLKLAREVTGLPIVTEIMDISQLPLFDDVDIIQVGARNMQNFDLLQELGKTNKPILLKRGLANTLQELLMSTEYIMSQGNENIILCERGIRTYETYTRNTLDISAIPVLHELSHLPVVVDPSHATGKSGLVPSMAVAAAAAGADGIMIEVHNNPSCALCDGAQSLTPTQFAVLNQKISRVREVVK